MLGALLFVYFEWSGGSGGPGSTRIDVTAGMVDHLASGFTRTWQRPPTDAELKGLVDDYVKEEIATREAAAMGLDRDDTIIRRRLRQKFEFLADEAVESSPPSDAEIQTWVDAHRDVVRSEPQLAFRQVYVSPGRRGASARAEAEKLLVRLRASGPELATDDLGDPSMLPAEQSLDALRAVSRSFGEDFAEELATIEPGQWTGPVESPYGLHLVLVTARVPAALPDLASIRPAVERELLAERRKAELDSLYGRLLQKYAIAIEQPKVAALRAADGGEAP